MIAGRALNKFINIFTGLFAMATLVLMLVGYINSAFGGLLPLGAVSSVESARNYCMLATIFLAGTEFTLKRSAILFGIFAVIVVAVAVFMLYTDLSY